MSIQNTLVPILHINNLDRLNAWFWSQTNLYERNPQNVLSDINELRKSCNLAELLLVTNNTRLLEYIIIDNNE